MEYKELENCKLCSWKCGVDRLAGEKGVCLMGIPEVASCQLHPAPPQSYTVFLSGCNFKCLNCQNWSISHYPLNDTSVLGYLDPKSIANEGVKAIKSPSGRLIGADRFFFSGGSPTVSLPWIEEVVHQAQSIDSTIKVNFDTNGFPSKESFRRILSFSDSITFDIKAFNDKVHRALTGAPVEPVLQNVETMAQHKDRLWEFRVLVIPPIINSKEIQALSEFLVALDETLPVCFLTFRPNFCLDSMPGASRESMEEAVEIARKEGLINVGWAGFPDIPGTVHDLPQKHLEEDLVKRVDFSTYYARKAGCKKVNRYCGTCEWKTSCELKAYIPSRRT